MPDRRALAANMADSDEVGEIDQSFWAKEDATDERKQLLWSDVKPCSWASQRALPRVGYRRVGDVFWPASGDACGATTSAIQSVPITIIDGAQTKEMEEKREKKDKREKKERKERKEKKKRESEQGEVGEEKAKKNEKRKKRETEDT